MITAKKITSVYADREAWEVFVDGRHYCWIESSKPSTEDEIIDMVLECWR